MTQYLYNLAKVQFVKRTFVVSNTLLSGSGSRDQIPKTGNILFDVLACETDAYPRWVNNLTNRGIQIIYTPLPKGTHAEISQISRSVSLTIKIDISQFTDLDLLHESRHFRQILVIRSAGYNVFNKKNIALAEKGAYQYELLLADKYNFTREYKIFAQQRIADYWTASIQKKFRFDDKFRDLARLLDETFAHSLGG